jgi:hypothetical protein
VASNGSIAMQLTLQLGSVALMSFHITPSLSEKKMRLFARQPATRT